MSHITKSWANFTTHIEKVGQKICFRRCIDKEKDIEYNLEQIFVMKD